MRPRSHDDRMLCTSIITRSPSAPALRIAMPLSLNDDGYNAV